MDLLAVVGSPRKGKATDKMVDKVIEGLRSRANDCSVKKTTFSDDSFLKWIQEGYLRTLLPRFFLETMSMNSWNQVWGTLRVKKAPEQLQSVPFNHYCLSLCGSGGEAGGLDDLGDLFFPFDRHDVNTAHAFNLLKLINHFDTDLYALFSLVLLWNGVESINQ